jgi:hypothetical protein
MVCRDGSMGTKNWVMLIRTSVLAAAAAAFALAGCGSSGSSSQTAKGGTNRSPDSGAAVVRAADVTGSSSGYRFQATMSITGASTPVKATMSGTVLSAAHRGELALHESVLGESVNISERYSGKTFWISASGIPGGSKLTGKPWLRFELGTTLNQLGLGGLPSGSSDPAQFLTYLKAAGGAAQRLGTQSIGGVATTHYAVTVDLDDYVRLAPAAQRATARKTVQRLISVIGSNTMHMQVWIDARHLARRLVLSFPECVAQQHLHLNLTMNLFDFGTKAKVSLPPASQSYDITSLVDQQLGNQKVSCSAS